MNKLYNTRIAVKRDAARLGELHKMEISSGFLSTLSDSFLTVLYENIIEHGVVYVVETTLSDDEEVVGFISCVESTKKFYISFLLHNCIRLLPLVFSEMFSVRFFSKAIESLKAPFKKSDNDQQNHVELDCPELLSIAVASEHKRNGLGEILLNSLESELRSKNFYHYKVIAGSSLYSANSFYEKNEFKLSANIVIHKGEVSNIYIKAL